MVAHTTARTHGGNTIRQILLISALFWVSACAREGKFVNPNDELRRKNLELAVQVHHLERRIDEHITRIEMLEGKLKGELYEGMESPKVAQIKFGRYSGPIDIDNDGADDLIRIYLRTLDQQGRFVPVTSLATVQAVWLSPDAPPQMIVKRVYDANEFDEAYRSSFTGTHYTLEVSLPSPLPQDLDRVEIGVFIKDAGTGMTYSHAETMDINPRKRSS